MIDDDIVTGSNTKIIIEDTNKSNKKTVKVENDLNKDGVFDKKDIKIAGKTLVNGVKNIFKKK